MEISYVYVRHEVWESHFNSMQDSTADSWTPPSGRFDISDSEFAGRKIEHIFPKLIDGMQPYLEDGGLVGRITTDHPATASSIGMVCTDKARHSKAKVDLSIFESFGGHSPGLISECDLTKEEEDLSTSHQMHYLARTEWDRIVVPIAVESSRRPCAFGPISAESKSQEVETIGSGTVSGRIAQHVGKIFEHQHRNFVFSIYIHGGRVFLIRSDRLGAVVSEPFSLIEEPHKLLGFLSRLSKMSLAQRGYDTSIRPASEIEAKEFTAFIPVDSVAKAYLEDALQSDGDKKAAIFRVDLQDLESSDMSVQLVFARPRVLGKGVEGRATRGYIAYDLVNKRLVFLKDYWQPDTKSYHLELDTYKRLQAKDVPCVATPVGGGYVASHSYQPKGSSSLQRTLTQVYLSAAHDECYRARVHYRFAVQEIGRPLEDYRNAREMLRVVCFALAAHKAAWEEAGVLHRDVSPGNILITGDGRGILNDWDMCKYKEDVVNPQSSSFRSGTWQFMSALLLCCPEKPNEVSDDVESFVHVINWLTLRYQVTSSPYVIDCSLRFFEEYRRTEAGDDVGGTLKLENFKGGIPFFGTHGIHPVALKFVVQEMLKMCKEHYCSPGVVNQLIRSGVEAPVKPLVLSATSRRHKFGPLPDWKGCNVHPIELPTRSAPVDSKPLMDDHQRIVEILMGAIQGATDPQLWAGEKLEDQFLKRPTQADSECGTTSGCSAGTQGAGTSQQHSQSGQNSTHNHNESITHAKRGLASSEESEAQGRSKRVKRSNEGRLVEGGEGHDQAGDR